MNLAVKKLDLIWDGSLPCDSLAGDKHRQVFSDAKPLIDYAFKVEKPAFVRVWWFDRRLDNVIDFKRCGGRPRGGEFYTIDCLKSMTDTFVAAYLAELGWQVRVTLRSFDRLEYAVLAVFSSEGALLREDEDYKLQSLFEEEMIPEYGSSKDWLQFAVCGESSH